MTLKQLYFPDNLIPPEKNKFRDTGGSKAMDLTADLANAPETSDNHHIFKLQEMEQHIARLESIIEQQTNKLIEITATNAKFITIIAHDLRGPFSSIIGSLELIKEESDHYNLNAIERYANIAYNSAFSTLELLDELLAWAVSQNKESTFNPVKINLNDLLISKIGGLVFLANQKRITLNHTIDANLSVSADLDMVKAILRNLIGNAIKYTSNGGKINISATEIAPFVEIIIKDNGIGISYKAQAGLFKKNTFHSTSGTNNEKGTGLGLLLCKEFVEMHGGTIRMEGEPGSGCEFRFTLPHYI